MCTDSLFYIFYELVIRRYACDVQVPEGYYSMNASNEIHPNQLFAGLSYPVRNSRLYYRAAFVSRNSKGCLFPIVSWNLAHDVACFPDFTILLDRDVDLGRVRKMSRVSNRTSPLMLPLLTLDENCRTNWNRICMVPWDHLW